MGDIQKPQQQQQPEISPHLIQLIQAFLAGQPQQQAQQEAPAPYIYQRKGEAYVQPKDPYTDLAFQTQRVNPVTGAVEYIDTRTGKDWTTAETTANPMLDPAWRKAYQLQGLHPDQQALYEWDPNHGDEQQGYGWWILPEEVQANYDYTPFGGWVPRGTQAPMNQLAPIDMSAVLQSFFGNTGGRPTNTPPQWGGDMFNKNPLARMATGNQMNPVQTTLGNPNPMDKVLGGPSGMNPFKPKRTRFGIL
jgi:hypothetical protein